MNVWGPLGVALFELRRSFTVGRIALWCLMAGFPVVLISLVLGLNDQRPPETGLMVVIFILVVRVSCVMGLLLWATPVVNSEIEGRTWVYVVSRPTGSRSVVLGKYLVALLWAISAGLTSAAIVVPLAEVEEPFAFFRTLAVLVVLGSAALGAVFMLIGALVQRRAMVVAMVYLVFFAFNTFQYFSYHFLIHFRRLFFSFD